MSDVKPGLKTTEFAVLVALLAFTAIVFAMGHKDAGWMALSAALASIGYSVSRGMVKG